MWVLLLLLVASPAWGAYGLGCLPLSRADLRSVGIKTPRHVAGGLSCSMEPITTAGGFVIRTTTLVVITKKGLEWCRVETAAEVNGASQEVLVYSCP